MSTESGGLGKGRACERRTTDTGRWSGRRRALFGVLAVEKREKESLSFG